jgi:poly(3-hydroxybutyrate) depolymerase
MMVAADSGCRRRRLFTAFISISFIAGCSRYIDPNVPELIRPYTEPEFGREYLLYRPSSYDKQFSWPLIVVCAGAFPDSPNQRIRAWTQHAEKSGFLVAAPTLEGNRASWLSGAAKHVSEQREDEKRILSTIRHIRAGHNVSGDRIFIHGWSGGAPVALRTGLRHPDIFRAIAVSQPRFDEACLVDTEALVDRHQPVFVHYDISDVITGKQGSGCVEWLRSRVENLVESPFAVVRRDEMQTSVEFFEDVVRKVPWIRIRAIQSESGNF